MRIEEVSEKGREGEDCTNFGIVLISGIFLLLSLRARAVSDGICL